MRHDEDITFSASQCQGTAWNSVAEMCSVLLGLSLPYLSWFDGSGVPDLLPPGINIRGFASCFSAHYTVVVIRVEGEMAPLEEQILVPRTGTITSLGLCPLSEVLSSLLELCNMDCGHPCLQHDVVSEKSILPGSFLSRLEEEVGILFRLLGKLQSPKNLNGKPCTLGDSPTLF